MSSISLGLSLSNKYSNYLEYINQDLMQYRVVTKKKPNPAEVADRKFEELMDQLQLQWENYKVPEFHRRYYIEMIHSVSKLDAYERVLSELNNMKIGQAKCQVLHKLTRGREKCLYMLKKQIREDEKTMDSYRRISELISHLRILTLNFVEKFAEWKSQFPQNKYHRWVYHNWNYILKVSVDTRFLKELPDLQEFFPMTQEDDPFFLSLVEFAFNSNTEFDDYLLVHKLPRSLLKRIRQSELVIVQEQYLDEIQHQMKMDKPYLSRQNSSKLIPDRLQYQSETKNVQDLSAVQPVQKQQRPMGSKVILSEGGYDLCIIPTEDFDQVVSDFKNDQILVNSFRYDKTLSEIALYGQESSFIYVYKENKVQGQVLISVDSGCVTVKRWIIHLLQAVDKDLFKPIVAALIKLIQDEEIQISLYHFEYEDKLQEYKDYKEVLKGFGFRWKQTVNNSDFRYTIYYLRRQIDIKVLPEPIIVQIGLYQAIPQSGKIDVDEIDLLHAVNVDIRVCNMMFHFFAKTIEYLDIKDKETKELEVKIKKSNGKLPATKQITETDVVKANEFFTIDKKQEIKIAEQPEVNYLCQMTNIQLRWIQSREIIMNGRRYIEFPKNNDEFVIKGVNQFFKRPIYLVSTSDPKFTVFFVECIDADELKEKSNKLAFYTQAIASFTDEKQMVDQDLIVPQIEQEDGDETFFVKIRSTCPTSLPNSIIKPVDQNAILLTGAIIMGVIHEDVVSSYDRPLVAVLNR